MKRINLLFVILFCFTSQLRSNDQPSGTTDPYQLFQEEEYLEAASLFLENAHSGKDGITRSNGFYNAACSFFEDFTKNRNTESLDKSIWLYYRVLQLDENNRNAAHNLELARKIQIERQQNQEDSRENQQKQDQDREKIEDPLSGMSQEQKELASRDDQTSSEHRKLQEELNQKTENALNNSENPEEKEKLQQILEKQKQALTEMKEKRGDRARDLQEEAAQMLQQLEQNKNQDNQKAMNNRQTGESLPEQDRIDPEIQQILNSELARQDQKEKSQDNYNFVEKNW